MTRLVKKSAVLALTFGSAALAMGALPLVSRAASGVAIEDAMRSRAYDFERFAALPALPESKAAKLASLHDAAIAPPRAVRDRLALTGLEPLSLDKIARAAQQDRAHDCLSLAVYYESRSETLAGQKAVGEVVLNRVASKYYPSSVCGVIYQGSARKTGCQFSFTCDGSMDNPPRGKAWERAQDVSTFLLTGLHYPMTRGATHYHTTDVNPHWADSLKPTALVGSHAFYRNKTRAERKAQNAAGSAALEVAP